MNVDPGLPEDVKYQRLKKRVGDLAMEYLIRLWGHCQQAMRGNRWPGKGADYVEAVCRWTGKDGDLYTVLTEVGWVRVKGDGVIIHNWDKHNKGLLSAWKNGPLGGRKSSKSAGTDRFATGSRPVHGSSRADNPPATDKEPAGDPMKELRRNEGRERAHARDPHIPSEEEFLRLFATAGIPDDYLRSKWTWFEGNNAWLDRHGRLKKFEKLVIDWWRTDEAGWKAKNRKNGAGRLDELRQLRDTHVANRESAYFRPSHTPEEASDLKRIREEIKKIEEGA